MLNLKFLRALAMIAQLAGLIALSTTAGLAQTPLRVEISGVGATQIPIAIAGFADESIAPQQVSAIIKADLLRSGYFKIIDTGNSISESAPVNYADWKSRGADALAVGSVRRLADGRLEVRYKLLDTIKSAQLSSMTLMVQPQFLRLPA